MQFRFSMNKLAEVSGKLFTTEFQKSYKLKE